MKTRNDGRRSTHAPAERGLFALTAIAAALWLVPQAVRADNECVPVGTAPSANGAAADTYTCTGASTYSTTGITYSSAGPLTVNSTGAMNVGTVGINLAGNGADNVTFTSTGTLTGTAGPVLDAMTSSGNINITNAGITGTNVNVTHGIRAESSAGGNVTVNHTTGAINVGSTTAGAQQQSAIRVVSSGGNGNVSVTSAGTVTGRLRGIEAIASGSGALTVNANNSVSANGGGAGIPAIAAIDATSGAGLLTVNLGTVGSVSGGDGAAIRVRAGGDAVVNIVAGRASNVTANAAGYSVDVDAGGTATVYNGSRLAGRVRIAGDNYVFTNDAGAIWSLIATGSSLGAGTINNAGTIRFSTSLGSSVTNTAQETTSLNNTTAAVEVISAHGATFNGTGASLLQMGVRQLNGVGQTGCATATIADCLDLSGGTTTGVTTVQLRFGAEPGLPAPIPGRLQRRTSAQPGIVLVDVSGGTSGAGHFVLDPGTEGYVVDDVYGSVLDFGGLLDYTIVYDPTKQQHLLTTVPGEEAVQYASYMREALSAWHVTADAVAGRQADVRNGGATGKVWFRAVNESTQRDAAPISTQHGNTFTYDSSNSSWTRAGIFGFDASAGENHVVGVHVGFVFGGTDFSGSPTSNSADGATAGLYAGWWQKNGLSVDATFNVNALTLDRDVVGLEEQETEAMTFGARAEAGWRLPLMEAFWLQPLITVAWAKTDINALDLKDNQVRFENADSLRTALGLRIGGEVAVADSAKVGYWLLGRAWNEQGGDGRIAFPMQEGGALTIEDDLSGGIREFGLGVSASNKADTLSAFLSAGARSSDDADSYNVSLGARVRW